MNTKLLRLAASGILTVGTVTGTVVGDALTPAGVPHNSRAIAQDADEQINIRVYQKASPAVVSVSAGKETGSGSIVSSDGLVLTNAHVVASATGSVSVTLADGRRLPAEVIAFGERGLDLAMLRIPNQSNLPALPIAASSAQVGQRAFAIGNPFGRFQGTFTVGIVSRIDRQRGLIQTDAAINPGNSGGPLLNSQGELIGVNTAIFTARQGGNIGIGFAISTDRVRPFLSAVREGRAPRTASRSSAPAARTFAPKPLSLNGQPVAGKLGPGSLTLRADSSFFDIYTFEGRAGQRVTLEMTSQEIDPFLILLNPRGRDVAQDNDGGGGNSARIVATLPATGKYTVIANSSQAGESGAYSLRAFAGSAAGAGIDPGPEGTMNVTIQSVLGPGASVLPSDGSLYRMTAFTGRAGQTVTITLESPDFDTYLVLLSPDGKVFKENNNSSNNTTDSAITATLPRSGVYRVIVNASDRDGRGRYTLTIR
ncbi:trypsin-like peptidase domain-containing protein [Kamptonema formosum]|uniref:trypsin-like peptidase domain-containing protein n=1 Tax=Kamptonema formosum TaxID=331992 RepID=UPI00034A754F|nr:trypsin-like peptidase domain-containing protein [Oscillatoria sp. PCC 10802]